MKRINIIIPAFVGILCMIFTGCTKDNYSSPGTWLTGRLVYQGESFYMDGYYSNDKPDEVIQFYQDGYGKYGAWGIRVKEDGTFSNLLFNGEYKLTVRGNTTYPFEWTGWPKKEDGTLDTMYVNLKGNTEIPDIEVTPYFEINDIEMAGGVFITATFTLKEILPDAGVNIEKVCLYVGPTNIVTSSPKMIHTDVSNIDINAPITIRMPVAQYRQYANNFRDYCYARIAVKTDKSERMLWSSTHKVENLPITINDITSKHFKNYAAPFKPASWAPQADSYSTPADWVVTDPVKIYTSSGYDYPYGGLELRFGRNCVGAISYDTNPQASIENGKMYQTTTLPAGRYLFSATPFPVFDDLNATGCGHIVVAAGNDLPNKANLASSIAYSDTMDNTFLEFSLDAETTITAGFVFNFPSSGPLAYGFTAISLIAIEE